MSSHQELPSLHASMKQSESIIHIANTAPLFLLLAPMDPEPTANPHAELVMDCFEGPSTTESPAPDRSPITPPDLVLARGLGSRGGEEPAVEKEDEFLQEGEIVDVSIDQGCGEDVMLLNSWVCLPRLVGQGEDPIGLGQRIVVVKDRVKCGGGYTLPSLKELGLDIFVRKQN